MADIGRAFYTGLGVGRKRNVRVPCWISSLNEIAQRRLSLTRTTALKIWKHYIAAMLATRVHWRCGRTIPDEVTHFLLVL